MEKINGLFELEILKVVEAFPSIYTKDDVVSLLTTLRTQVLTEVSELKPTGGITEEKFHEFANDVENQLSRELNNGNIEICDYSSAEFAIDYGNKLELENIDINTDNIIYELNAILLDQFKAHFKESLTDKPE